VFVNVDVELGPMIPILVLQCESRDNFTRLTVLTWLTEFINLGKGKLLPFVADILGSAIQCISDAEKEIRQKSEYTNEILLNLVQSTDEQLPLGPLLAKITLQLANKWVPSRLAALRWIKMLLGKSPGQFLGHLSELFPALLRTLQDPDDAVVSLDLQVLAGLSLDSSGKLDNKNFNAVLNHIIKLFSENRKFLEQRGALIIRNLCELLEAENIYTNIATILRNNSPSAAAVAAVTESKETSSNNDDKHPEQLQLDLDFISLMVQTLNLILLTSNELHSLRNKLKNSLSSAEGKALFKQIYSTWCYSSVSLLCLCLFASAYDLAALLVVNLSEAEITVGTLMQIDKLVQLLESPIFINLRLQLLEPQRNSALIKSLYGVLMLLPQSAAYQALQNRLLSVTTIVHINNSNTNSNPSSNQHNSLKVTQSQQEINDFLALFKQIQAKFSAKRLKQLSESSLLTKSQPLTTEDKK
jgi:vacuole morphology and inheritance protein 14